MDSDPGRRHFLTSCLVAAGIGTVWVPGDIRPASANRTTNHDYRFRNSTEKPSLDQDLASQLDTAVEIRDRRENRASYEPKAGAKFLATDTGKISIGDGERWMDLSTTGVDPTVDTLHVESINGVYHVDPDDGYEGLTAVLESVGDTPSTVAVGPGRIDDIDGNVTIPSNTWLHGQGQNTTALAFEDGADLDLAGLLRITGENVRISDLELDGNRESVSLGATNLGQEYGLYTAGAYSVTVDRLYCHSFPGYGIDPHADGSDPSRFITISNCRVENNGFDGVALAGVEHGVITGTVSADNDRHGINLTDPEGSSIRVVNNTATENGGSGFVVQNNTRNVVVSNNTFTDNDTDGVRIGNGGSYTEEIVLTSNHITSNEGYGVNIRPARSISISNSVISANNRDGDSTAEIALTADSTATDIVVTGNQIKARPDTDHGFDERDGNGPCLLAGNLIRGSAKIPIASTHPDTTAEANLTSSL